jgi:hypothetical protein
VSIYTYGERKQRENMIIIMGGDYREEERKENDRG